MKKLGSVAFISPEEEQNSDDADGRDGGATQVETSATYGKTI